LIVINFRYHVVSLTAVFLALAIGLVVGTAALNGPAVDTLNEQISAMRKTNNGLRDEIQSLRDEASRKGDYVLESSPYVLNGKLANRRVLVISFSSGRDYIKGVKDQLTASGAKITGTISLQDKLTYPKNNAELIDLAERALPPSLNSITLPGNSVGVETATALLAAVLMDRTPAVPAADQRAVLSAFSKSGYLSVEGTVSGPAEAVVMIAGAPYYDKDAPSENDAVVTTVVQFDKAGAIAVAGALSGDGNVISAVRGDPALVKTISTVDDTSTPAGQVVSVLAIWEQLTQGKAGQYGIGAGATSLMPKLSS